MMLSTVYSLNNLLVSYLFLTILCAFSVSFLYKSCDCIYSFCPEALSSFLSSGGNSVITSSCICGKVIWALFEFYASNFDLFCCLLTFWFIFVQKSYPLLLSISLFGKNCMKDSIYLIEFVLIRKVIYFSILFTVRDRFYEYQICIL